MYHLVCPAKYRRKVITKEVSETLKNTCIKLGEAYQIHFLEIGTDIDHVHFLIKSVPTLSPSKIAQIVKSITAREIFKIHPEVKQQLYGGQFWTDGFYINTVGQYANKEVIQKYVKNQGKSYTRLYESVQPSLFDSELL